MKVIMKCNGVVKTTTLGRGHTVQCERLDVYSITARGVVLALCGRANETIRCSSLLAHVSCVGGGSIHLISRACQADSRMPTLSERVYGTQYFANATTASSEIPRV